ncbi:MAG: TetR/AcrR family transcriptional regulator [Myxococcales bacterium]|nr:TetR/AcrR family transcriptional regulator [Myxococcales bacterium]
MPRPPNTDERRAQITAALIEVMARRGYDGASIAQIASAAGLTPGLIHYHFRTKQEILLAALDALVARHEARLDEALASAPGSAKAAVSTFIDLHLGLGASADPAALACWILLSGEALRQPAVRVRYAAALDRLVERLRAILERGMREGELLGLDREANEAPSQAPSSGRRRDRGGSEDEMSGREARGDLRAGRRSGAPLEPGGVDATRSAEAAEAAAALVAAIQGYFVLAATARALIPPGSASRSVHAMAEGLLGCALPAPARGLP